MIEESLFFENSKPALKQAWSQIDLFRIIRFKIEEEI